MNQTRRSTIGGIGTLLRSKRRALVGLVLIPGGLWILWWFLEGPRGAASLSPGSGRVVSEKGGGEFAKVWERLALERPIESRSAIEGAEAADPCDFDAVASLRLYVGMVRAISDPRHRLDEIERPARELLSFPSELRRALGVLDPKALRLDFEFGRQRLELPLPDALMERWFECARNEEQREALSSEVLGLLLETTRFGLEHCDQAQLELTCLLAGHLERVEDVEAIFLSLRPLLEKGLQDPALARGLVDPVLALISQASRLSYARPLLLALVDTPWMKERARAFPFLVSITVDRSFADWEEAITALLAHETAGLRWAAIEALRGFASHGLDERGSGLGSDRLLELVSDDLFRHPDGSLRMAALELVATFGGAAGRERLLGLLEDPSMPRSEILTLLSLQTGPAQVLDADRCRELLSSGDPDLVQSAIAAMGELQREDMSLRAELHSLALSSEDPAVRRQAMSALALAEDEGAVEVLALGVRDLDPDVQLEAVRQLGLLAAPQVELLESIARDPTREGRTRERAFQEWMIDAPDSAVVGIIESMYADFEPRIKTQGYLWRGALAIATGESDAIERWKTLPIPRELLESATESPLVSSLAGAFPSRVQAAIEQRVQTLVGELESHRRRNSNAGFLAGLELVGEDSRALRSLRRPYEFEERIRRYIEARRNP